MIACEPNCGAVKLDRELPKNVKLANGHRRELKAVRNKAEKAEEVSFIVQWRDILSLPKKRTDGGSGRRSDIDGRERRHDCTGFSREREKGCPGV